MYPVLTIYSVSLLKLVCQSTTLISPCHTRVCFLSYCCFYTFCISDYFNPKLNRGMLQTCRFSSSDSAASSNPASSVPSLISSRHPSLLSVSTLLLLRAILSFLPQCDAVWAEGQSDSVYVWGKEERNQGGCVGGQKPTLPQSDRHTPIITATTQLLHCTLMSLLQPPHVITLTFLHCCHFRRHLLTPGFG